MKAIQLITILNIFFFSSSCGQANNKTSDQQIKNMLTEFYTAYLHVLTDVSPQPYYIKDKKLDSLMQKYCTSKLKKEAKEALENVGVDVLTNNLGSVDLNENLKVEKIFTKENEYVVSFIATNADASGNPFKQQVIIHVTVVKDGESYKIADVK